MDSLVLQIEDDGATGSLGYLGSKRVGNDPTGKFSINTYTAGTPAENLTLTAAGVLTGRSVVADLTGPLLQVQFVVLQITTQAT